MRKLVSDPQVQATYTANYTVIIPPSGTTSGGRSEAGCGLGGQKSGDRCLQADKTKWLGSPFEEAQAGSFGNMLSPDRRVEAMADCGPG